jgi:hypothetical protein
MFIFQQLRSGIQDYDSGLRLLQLRAATSLAILGLRRQRTRLLGTPTSPRYNYKNTSCQYASNKLDGMLHAHNFV